MSEAVLPPAGPINGAAPAAGDELEDYSGLDAVGRTVLLGSIVVVALCGIVYELIIGTVSSYLLGNSVYQFSLTIGFFMFAMGVGSYVSQHIGGRLLERFIIVEIILALVGGICSISLFLTFPLAPAFYQAVMFGFIFTIGALVGLEIPLLTRVLAEGRGTRRSIAQVLSLDYIGALVGSVAFPLMLLPSLGLVRASFAIGLANALVALVNVLYLRAHLRHFRTMLAVVIIVVIALAGFTAFGARLASFAQHHLFLDTVIWKKQTPYQSLVVTRNDLRGDLRLFIDGHIQFSSEDEHRYHEALVHPVMGWGSAPAHRILVMGGGDGLAVREVLKHPDVVQVDVVDLDPDMTWLGAEFNPLVELNDGALREDRVRIINEDAFSYLARPDTPLYDRAILDFPDPHDEAIAKLYSVEFYARLARRMTPGGVMATQSSSPFFARRAYWSVEATMGEIFEHTVSYHITVPAFGPWGFHMASMAPGKNQATDTALALPEGLRFLTPDVFRSAQVFPADMANPGPGPQGTLVNSLFEPKLYELYVKGLMGP